MKKILSTLVLLPVLLVVSCFASPSENDTTTQDVVILGAVALAMSNRTATPVGSCNFPANGSCVDYYTGWTASLISADCPTGSGAVIGTGACSASTRVGSCAVTNRAYTTQPSGTTAIWRLYSVMYTVGTAQTNCNATPTGVFTAN